MLLHEEYDFATFVTHMARSLIQNEPSKVGIFGCKVGNAAVIIAKSLDQVLFISDRSRLDLAYTIYNAAAHDVRNIASFIEAKRGALQVR